jgi:ABC-type Fe3+-hydroxamate transport system substrate-binding protein
MVKEQVDEHNSYTYESMSMDELKNSVIKYWKEIKNLEAEKKDHVESINSVIKELKNKIDDVVYWVGIKETKEERAKLEAAAVKALEKGK